MDIRPGTARLGNHTFTPWHKFFQKPCASDMISMHVCIYNVGQLEPKVTDDLAIALRMLDDGVYKDSFPACGVSYEIGVSTTDAVKELKQNSIN